MDIIIAILSAIIGGVTLFLVGNFFGQGVMIGYLLYSDDPGEVVIGKSWYNAFQWGLKHDDGLFDRLVVELVLAGIECYRKSNERSNNHGGS